MADYPKTFSKVSSFMLADLVKSLKSITLLPNVKVSFVYTHCILYIACVLRFLILFSRWDIMFVRPYSSSGAVVMIADSHSN